MNFRHIGFFAALAVALVQIANVVYSLVAMAIGAAVVVAASRLPGAQNWRGRSVRWIGGR